MATTFQIRPIGRFKDRQCAIKRPKVDTIFTDWPSERKLTPLEEIACFSFDEEHKFRLDASSLRYYHTPKIGVSLSEGFEEFKKHDDSNDEHIDALLKTIIAVEQQNGQRVVADFITWRGMMTKFLIAAFNNESFEMRATRFQGTIYIEENHQYKLRKTQAEAYRPRRAGGQPSGEVMSYWGYKFETLCTLPDTWDNTSRDYIESRDRIPVSNYAQYCSVVQTTIKGQSNIIMGGEVDAVWDEKPEDSELPTNWVELKTYRDFRPSNEENSRWERRLLKFWAQSFLLGVPRILVGLRSEVGVLNRVQDLKTTRIPASVRSGQNSWDFIACLNCMAAILEFLKENIGDGVWLIKRDEGSWNITVERQEGASYSDILSPEFLQWRGEAN